MDPLEQEYLANVERANARDRRRELFIGFLTSGFIRPVSDIALDDIMDGRTRNRVRALGLALCTLTSVLAVFAYAPGSRRHDNACIMLFVLASAGAITLAKYVYGIWRARRNARLQLEWERRFDADPSARMP